MFAVCDEGDGVPGEFLPYLFTKFTQAGRGERSHAGGTGLGLAIVHALVAEMDGDVWYEPNEPSGSRFVISLHAAIAAPVPQR